MPRIRFGTDGWRAVMGEDFTFENVRICAQGAADYVNSTGLAPRGFVIGYDTRFASRQFAEAVAEVMAANGVPDVPMQPGRADSGGQPLAGVYDGWRRGGDNGEPQPGDMERFQVQARLRRQRVE